MGPRTKSKSRRNSFTITMQNGKSQVNKEPEFFKLSKKITSLANNFHPKKGKRLTVRFGTPSMNSPKKRNQQHPVQSFYGFEDIKRFQELRKKYKEGKKKLKNTDGKLDRKLSKLPSKTNLLLLDLNANNPQNLSPIEKEKKIKGVKKENSAEKKRQPKRKLFRQQSYIKANIQRFSSNSALQTKVTVDYEPKHPLKNVDLDGNQQVKTMESYHYKMHFLNKTKKKKKKVKNFFGFSITNHDDDEAEKIREMVQRGSRRHIRGNSYYFGKKPIVCSKKIFKPKHDSFSFQKQKEITGEMLKAEELRLSDYNKINYSHQKDRHKTRTKLLKTGDLIKQNKRRIKSMDQRMLKNAFGRPVYV